MVNQWCANIDVNVKSTLTTAGATVLARARMSQEILNIGSLLEKGKL